MKNYRSHFRTYLDDLAARRPHPGGGSCAALAFCAGISLIEMALAYSKLIPASEKKFFEKAKSRVFPFIDKDGEIFAALMKEKKAGKKKVLLGRAQKMICQLGCLCDEALARARKICPKINKGLNSDFYLGLKFLESALYASLLNLEANEKLFAVDNRCHIRQLKTVMRKYKAWLK